VSDQGAPLSLRGAAVSGVAWTVLRVVASRLTGSVVFIVLARLLDPHAFGIVALASVFVVLISLLVESGFGEALIQRRELTRTDLDTAFWANNALSVSFALLVLVGADLLSTPFGEPQLAPVLRVLSLVFLCSALASVPQAILRRDLRFRALTIRTIAATTGGGIVGVAMAAAGAGVWSLVGQMIATAVIGTTTLWRTCSWRPGLAVSRQSLTELTSFSAKVLGERLAFFTSRRADDLLIGLVLGPVALGLYAAAYRLLLLFTELVIWTIEGVAFPLLSRLQHDAERAKRAFYTITELCCGLAIPSFLALAVLAPEIIRVTLGPGWDASIPVMQVLAPVGIPQVAIYCNKAAFNAAGRPDVSLRIAVGSAVANVIGFVVSVQWGILAVATSYVVCSYLVAPVSVWALRAVLPIEIGTYLRLFLAPTISGVIMVLCLSTLQAALGELSDVAVLAISLPVAAAVYIGMLFLTGRGLLRSVLAHATALRSRGRGFQHEGATAT
jgi:O-antigen/teichoic acid export membrane protein